MSINLSKVNISLNEFQRLSIGEHNAGEVKLAGETKLAKMNNHVGSFFVNKDIISHEEVIAIKQALVKALRLNGVQEETLNKIRMDLGLATVDPSDRDLRHRSIMPLTRQKIREILDQNAAVINAFNAEHGGDVRIRTSNQIYGPGGMDEARAAKRDAVNAKLVEHDRQVNVDQGIMCLQSILTNTADFTNGEEREKIIALAKAQLEALMEKCDFRSRANEPATAVLELEHGREVSISTGMNEVEYMTCLEDLIVRMTYGKTMPDPVEGEVVSQYRACNSDDERTAFLDALPNGAKAGLKARALAVRCLYGRGVTDYETLAVANGLGDADALALAKALLAMPKDATPEQIRANPVLVRLAEQAPVPLENDQMAYIPATSNAQYNKFVVESLATGAPQPLPQYRELAMRAIDAVRSHLGEDALKADAGPKDVVDKSALSRIYHGEGVEEGRVRLTAEAMQGAFMDGRNVVSISGGAGASIASLVLKGSGILEAENPALEAKTRINGIAKSIMQTTVAQNIGDNLRRDIHNKPIDHFNFERPGTLFELDLPRKIKVRFDGGEALPEDDFKGARDRFVTFLTNDANATYAGADDKTKLKAHVLMIHATQSFLGSSQLGIAIAFHPEGKTGRINTNRDPNGGVLNMSVGISRDQDGNIVIGGDLTYKVPIVMMTRDGPEHEGIMARGDPDSYAKHHLEVVIADADLEKFVNAEWGDFNYGPIQDVDLDNDLPHHNEAAAGMLQGDYKLEYRKFDVSYDFHVNKLYEFDQKPDAPPREITL